nr:terminase small subunit [uncultured Butyrivibrio sp.]
MPSKELRKYKELSKEVNPEINAAALDMACACLKNLGGHPYKYDDSQEGLKAFIENSQGYFAYLQSVNSKLEEKQGIIPDVEGYALFLGVDRSTINRYHNRGGEWAETIDLFKNAIGYAKKQLMLKGKIPSVLAVFDLANNHEYLNTGEFKLSANVTNNDNKERSYDNIKSYRLTEGADNADIQ